jgi:hypothetical protein
VEGGGVFVVCINWFFFIKKGGAGGIEGWGGGERGNGSLENPPAKIGNVKFQPFHQNFMVGAGGGVAGG